MNFRKYTKAQLIGMVNSLLSQASGSVKNENTRNNHNFTGVPFHSARKALQISEKKYRTLFDFSPNGIVIEDQAGTILDANPAFCRMMGYSVEELIGKKVHMLSDMRTVDDVDIHIEEIVKGRQLRHVVRSRKKDGTLVMLSLNERKISLPEGIPGIVSIAEDITDRIAAEKILKESEKRYKRIFNAFPDIYFRTTLSGIIEEISPSVGRLAGFKSQEIIGKPAKEIFYDATDWEVIEKLLSEMKTINDFDTRLHTKKGSFIHCSLIAGYMFGLSPEPVGIEGVLRDITERKKSEEALRESQRQLFTLMSNLPGMVYRCRNDKDWTMEFISEGCTELTGYRPAELTGNKKVSYNEIIHADDRQLVWDKVQEGLKKQEPFRISYRIITKRNEERWVWEQGLGIFSETGTLIALEGFITDITEQKLADDEIRKFLRAAEQSPAIIMITDLDGKIEYVNPKFEKVTGYLAKEMIGNKPGILKSGQKSTSDYAELWKKLKTGKEWTGEFINKKKNGEIYWEAANISPLKDEDGNITHFLAVKEDITVRKQMEEDLIREKNKAEESDKLKSAFLANMSHEIRTPMNAILGFSQLLTDPETETGEKDHYLHLIQKSGSELMMLIDDIIDISRIEAGQIHLSKSWCIVGRIMDDIYDFYSKFIHNIPAKRNIDFIYRQPENAGEITIFTDPDRLKQVIRNLLNNAIKFTDKGKVEFGFTSDTDNGQSILRFYVSDTGIGINKEDLSLIFESFRQAKNSDSRIYGGTGLGLAISRKIIEILGGTIGVTSEPGIGSTFFFYLPLDESYIQSMINTGAHSTRTLYKNNTQ